jgi:cytochrome c-type biogenesis protein CcmE
MCAYAARRLTICVLVVLFERGEVLLVLSALSANARYFWINGAASAAVSISCSSTVRHNGFGEAVNLESSKNRSGWRMVESDGT